MEVEAEDQRKGSTSGDGSSSVRIPGAAVVSSSSSSASASASPVAELKGTLPGALVSGIRGLTHPVTEKGYERIGVIGVGRASVVWEMRVRATGARVAVRVRSLDHPKQKDADAGIEAAHVSLHWVCRVSGQPGRWFAARQ